MATRVRSTDGNNTDDGSSWASANLDIGGTNGGLADQPTGLIYVSQVHDGSTAGAVTWALSTDPTAPSEIICVNDSTESPTSDQRTTGRESSTGAGNFVVTGIGYIYGMTVRCSVGSAGTNSININTGNIPGAQRWSNCVLQLSNTGAGARINFGSTAASTNDSERFELSATSLLFGATGQAIRPGGRIEMVGGAIAASGSVPTTLFQPAGATRCNVYLDGVNLGAFGSGTSLVQVGTAATFGEVVFLNCTFGASVGVITGTIPERGGITVRVTNCDSTSSVLRNEFYRYEGHYECDTVVKRTGGASDRTTGYSVKMVSLAGANFYYPLYGPWMYVWNETPGSVSYDIELVNDADTLKDDEIGAEMRYESSGSTPISSVTLDRKSEFIAAGANQASSSETWTTTGITTPVTQKLTVAATTALKGWIRIRLLLMKPSETVWFCPKFAGYSYAQRWTPEGAILNEPKIDAAVIQSTITAGADGTEITGTYTGGGVISMLASGGMTGGYNG